MGVLTEAALLDWLARHRRTKQQLAEDFDVDKKLVGQYLDSLMEGGWITRTVTYSVRRPPSDDEPAR